MNLRDYWELNSSKVQATMREISLDDPSGERKEYMTESLAKVINFDMVKREFMNRLDMSEDEAKSVDGLFQVQPDTDGDADIYMVEFKNGRVEGRDIERKARDSVLIFQSITGTQLEDTRQNVQLVLVYNEERNSVNYREIRAIAAANQARVDFTRFGLAHLRGFCFKKVFAYNQNEFEKKIIPLVEG